MDALASYGSSSEDEDIDKKDNPSNNKRQRPNEPEPHEMAVTINPFLPPPHVESDCRSMLFWPTDLLSVKQNEYIEKKSKESNQNIEVAPNMADQMQIRAGFASWAEELRTQHDFHNPHLFAEIEELVKKTVSNENESTKMNKKFSLMIPNDGSLEEWESIDELMILEEKARINGLRRNN